MPTWIISEDEDGVVIAVKVVPKASRSEIVGAEGDWLKVRITAPPVEGAANEALAAFLAGALGLRKRDVTIAVGERSRLKHVRIRGLSAQAVAARLAPP
ncbi:MAG TPA: DUF167 family protein [Anaerolineae bacterium]|nr:DUF167 family protein [Anaerolineae bacterium]HPL29505.1 DUF167 family protein [Anaerolineae bacterium]